MTTIPTMTPAKAIDSLMRGGVGVMPTDTVYGLVARASDEQAVAKLYATKKRERKPGTVIAANVQQLVDLGIKKRYLSAVEQWWPNPLSVIIPTGEALAHLHQGLDSLAVRIPNDPTIQKILLQTGPLLTTSANLPDKPHAKDIEEAFAYFNGLVDFYVHGEVPADRQPSTIIRIVDDAIEILREGAVKIDDNGRLA